MKKMFNGDLFISETTKIIPYQEVLNIYSNIVQKIDIGRYELNDRVIEFILTNYDNENERLRCRLNYII